MAEFKDLLFKTLVSIEGDIGSDSLIFTTAKGDRYELYYDYD